MTDANLIDDLLTRAKRGGASAADTILVRSTSISVSVRSGKVEMIERSESTDLGLRVFKGQKQAIIATSDLRSHKLDELVSRVLDMADATPEDPYAGLAAPEQLCKNPVALDMAEASEPDPALLVKAAGEAEAAALAVSGITNTEGGDASWGRSDVLLATSNGFSGGYARTSCGISATALAGTGTGMERDYDYDSATHWADLRDATSIGKAAAERAVRRINPQRVTSQQVPILFEARQARDLVSHLVSAINGSSVARKSTFLRDKLGQAVCGAHITVHEDPFTPRGPRSRPFDGEGLPVQARKLIDAGILTTWLLDLRSARQLGLTPTGHGARGVGGPPSPSASNVWLAPGTSTPEAMIADIKQGLYLTDCLGHGTNMVTGDYSRGASGYWIENGKLTYPVSELTIAGNLADMFKAMQPANDLTRRHGMDSPSVLVTGMTVAGQ
jgi:PmbA protein